jgi:glycosyltransferase involved in cell wall biosynthesis
MSRTKTEEHRRLFVAAPDIADGDAVGNHCLGIGKAGQRLGYEVKFFARSHKTDQAKVHPIEELPALARPEDCLFLSYSIYEPILLDLLNCQAWKVAYFHGVTPAELLEPYDRITADLCRAAINQLGQLNRCDRMLSNSQLSASVLKRHGVSKPVTIIPPFTQDIRLVVPTRPSSVKKAWNANQDQFPNLLMVGRVVPHKNIEEAIEAVGLLIRSGIQVQLEIVGSTPCTEYLRSLKALVNRNSLQTAVKFLGYLSEEEKSNCYQRADIFIQCSQHEGFCVPLFEAMQCGLPLLLSPEAAATGTADSSIHIIAKGAPTLRDRIAELLSNPEEWTLRSERGIQRARDLFELVVDRNLKPLFSR